MNRNESQACHSCSWCIACVAFLIVSLSSAVAAALADNGKSVEAEAAICGGVTDKVNCFKSTGTKLIQAFATVASPKKLSMDTQYAKNPEHRT